MMRPLVARAPLGALPLIGALLLVSASAARLRRSEVRRSAADRSHGTRQEPRGGSDAVVEEVDELLKKGCSCDCCSVSLRLPKDQVTFKDGRSLTHQCVPPPLDMATDVCPAGQCQASNSDQTLTSAVATMDYSRFCQYKCKPSTLTVGTLCIQLTVHEIEKTVEETGNGNNEVNIYTPVSEEEVDWGSASEEAAEERAEEEERKQEVKDLNAHVVYDIRKILNEKARAEAGADMSQAAAAEARIKADAFKVGLNARKAARVEGALAGVASVGKEKEVEAAAHARAAAEEANALARVVTEARTAASKVVGEARAAATAEITAEASPLAKQEADADAVAFGWDKPPSWPKALAVRAADPYLKAMVTATQRVSEYEAVAKSLQGQALSAQGKLKKLWLESNAAESEHDAIGAATLRNQVDLLMGRWKGLEGQAEKYWKVASDVRETIPEFQIAGNQAAARAAWEYKINFTPPPEPAM